MPKIHCAALLIVLFLAATGAHGASLILNDGVFDTGDLFGLPGDTVGWGFSLLSTPILDGSTTIPVWLVVSNVDFVPDAGVFPVGVFTPFMTNTFTVIGPDDGNGEVNPWTQAFDPINQTGVGSYIINSFQNIGDTVTGNIVVTFDEYSTSPLDPAFDPTLDLVQSSLTVSAEASVTVGQAAPEPATWLFSLTGMLLLAGHLRRKARARHGVDCAFTASGDWASWLPTLAELRSRTRHS
jgi:hypothetical protein